MSDLISRKYVVKELLKEREHYPAMVAERYSLGVNMPHRFNQAMRGGIRKALRIAETAPAVDAEPVRHGRWIPEIVDCIETVFKCSECCRLVKRANDYGYKASKHVSHTYPYCHCGAKMRGDNDAAD